MSSFADTGSSKYWLWSAALVAVVHEVVVVFLLQVPVGCVAFNKAGNDNEAQNHQIDACEDLIHQRRLAHTKGQKSWGNKVKEEKRG